MVRVFPDINAFPVHPRQDERRGHRIPGVSIINVVKRLIKFRLRNEIGEYRVAKNRRRPRSSDADLFPGCATPLDGMLYCE
jgi:hypothetical protein